MRNLKRAIKILEALSQKWGRRAQVNTAVLSRTLNKEFKSLGVKFSFRANAEAFKVRRAGYAWHIQAYYDQRIPGVEPEGPLYEVIVIRDKNHKEFTVNKWFWNELYLVLAHEFKHGQQHRARKGRMIFRSERPELNTTDKDLNYLCTFDEIDAHAYECALEWRMKGGDLMAQWTVKKYYRKCRRFATPDWRRFVKRTYKYYHQLDGVIWQANKASSTKRRLIKSSKTPV